MTFLIQLEKALTYEKLMEWTRPEVMHQQEVQVSLPRFKMEETYDMKSLLVSMGMEDVFDGQVNLSGMSPNNDLVVSKVIHKAFVEVNEEGTEAAAATGVVMQLHVWGSRRSLTLIIRSSSSSDTIQPRAFCFTDASALRERILRYVNLAASLVGDLVRISRGDSG